MRTIYSSWLLDELVTRFGEGAVDRVIATYATVRISVPIKPSDKLIADLGADVAVWLTAERGGQHIVVPSAKHVKTKRTLAARDREIQNSNQTVPALAKKHDLSQRRIHAIKALAQPLS